MGDGGKALLITLAIAILLGVVIVIFDTTLLKMSYRPDYILLTNKKYYPTIEVLSKTNTEYEDLLNSEE